MHNCKRPGCLHWHYGGPRRHGYCCNACQKYEWMHTVNCTGRGQPISLGSSTLTSSDEGSQWIQQQPRGWHEDRQSYWHEGHNGPQQSYWHDGRNDAHLWDMAKNTRITAFFAAHEHHSWLKCSGIQSNVSAMAAQDAAGMVSEQTRFTAGVVCWNPWHAGFTRPSCSNDGYGVQQLARIGSATTSFR